MRYWGSRRTLSGVRGTGRLGGKTEGEGEDRRAPGERPAKGPGDGRVENGERGAPEAPVPGRGSVPGVPGPAERTGGMLGQRWGGKGLGPPPPHRGRGLGKAGAMGGAWEGSGHCHRNAWGRGLVGGAVWVCHRNKGTRAQWAWPRNGRGAAVAIGTGGARSCHGDGRGRWKGARPVAMVTWAWLKEGGVSTSGCHGDMGAATERGGVTVPLPWGRGVA